MPSWTATSHASVVAVSAVALLLLSACGSRPTASNEGGADPDSSAFTSCMVLDGGVDDRSFNQSSYAGLQEAKEENPAIEISYVVSSDDTAYTPNLNASVQKKCDSILAVGGTMADNVKDVATANPDRQFAEIDSSSQLPNVYGIQYNTVEAGFLGGYLAAGMTKTGTVGTFGGTNIPPVTVFMDGFWEGVQYYNTQKNTDVKVIGWDENNQQGGTFAGSYVDQAAGRQITETLFGQGADIIMPVAGQAGLGAGAAAEAAGGALNLLWVDTDGCVSAEQYCDYILSSVTKNLTDAVKDYTLKAAGGTFPTGGFVGTLANDGVGLAPLHTFESKVPSDLVAELDTVKQSIIDGTITISSPNAIAAS